ncbi:MAG: hypothetical protein F6J94_28410 [Moorea sp. SIO1F2]|uniref:hypothetical protein n=1 Tax=Moorena sp. SIO1F2 TaxID=2607819 RepID=UPI0013BC6757|nr:hypothetical protein [Moorena sp. SIO1F2]NET85676.1 hypothetical protein [Moorena sp. SIO1F2]
MIRRDPPDFIRSHYWDSPSRNAPPGQTACIDITQNNEEITSGLLVMIEYRVYIALRARQKAKGSMLKG